MIKKKGFTLVELLVVITIIALLLGFMMPALNLAKTKAQDVICRSNLKQWGLIWKVYANENKGMMPDCTFFGGLRGDWIVALREDYPTGKVTKCPTASKPNQASTDIRFGGVNWTHANGVDQCSYGMNNWSYSTSHSAMGSDAGKKIWKQLEVSGTNPSTIPLFMDSMFKGGFPRWPVNTWMDGMKMPDTESDNQDVYAMTEGGAGVMCGMRQFAMPRHSPSSRNAGTNVLFFDLSARHVNVKEMWTLKWYRDYDVHKYLNHIDEIWPGTWMNRFVDPD